MTPTTNVRGNIPDAPAYPYSRQRLDDAWNRLFEQQAADGMRHYLGSFTYKYTGDILDEPVTPRKITLANRLFRGVYIDLLKYALHERNYAKASYRPLQPIVVAAIDEPGKLKFGKWHSVPFPKSMGIHHHALIAADPEIAHRLDRLCGENTLTRTGLFAAVKTSHLASISRSEIERSARYNEFTLKEERFEAAVTVYPEGRTESLTRRSAVVAKPQISAIP